MMLSAHLISCGKKFHNEVDAASTNRFKCYSFIIFGTVNLMISNDDWDGTSLKNPINKKDASQWRALNTNSKIFNCTRLMIGSYGSAGLVERVSYVHVEELLFNTSCCILASCSQRLDFIARPIQYGPISPTVLMLLITINCFFLLFLFLS